MRKKNSINTFLAKDTEFDGRLSFKGTIRIDGRVKGDIIADGHLIVGRTGRIESNIQVSSIVISGEVRGNITARQSIEIQVPGKVVGDIQAPTVKIHEGVVFEGNCRTQQVDEADSAKVAVLRSAS